MVLKYLLQVIKFLQLNYTIPLACLDFFECFFVCIYQIT